MDAALWRLPQCHGHVQRPDCQISLHAITDSPTDDTPRIEIDDDSQVEPTFTRPDVGDVSCPFLVVLSQSFRDWLDWLVRGRCGLLSLKVST